MSKEDQLNLVNGIVAQVKMTKAEFTTYADAVFNEPNLWIIVDTNTYITDGTSALKDLKLFNRAPLSDSAILAAEEAFDASGNYTPGTGSILLHSEGGVVSRNQLDLFGSDGKLKSDILPELVAHGVIKVANIAERNAITDSKKYSAIEVADASADPTVTNGSALYTWSDDIGESGDWIKLAEVESLDVAIDKLIDQSDMVKYSHPIVIKQFTADELISLIGSATAPAVLWSPALLTANGTPGVDEYAVYSDTAPTSDANEPYAAYTDLSGADNGNGWMSGSSPSKYYMYFKDLMNLKEIHFECWGNLFVPVEYAIEAYDGSSWTTLKSVIYDKSDLSSDAYTGPSDWVEVIDNDNYYHTYRIHITKHTTPDGTDYIVIAKLKPAGNKKPADSSNPEYPKM